MIRTLLLAALLAAPMTARADCYADYKAKQENPLRLHYGVAEVRGECSRGNAAQQLGPRLARAGWTLLNVVSVFDDGGLAERRASAGQNYLRY